MPYLLSSCLELWLLGLTTALVAREPFILIVVPVFASLIDLPEVHDYYRTLSDILPTKAPEQ